MTEVLEKLQKVDGGKINGGAVALLAIVLFFYGKSMQALPETVADMARTQALLVYRIEQLERAIAAGHITYPEANWSPIGQGDSLGDRDAPLALDRLEPLPVRFELHNLSSWQALGQVFNTALSEPYSLQGFIPERNHILQPSELLPVAGGLVAAGLKVAPVIKPEVLGPVFGDDPPA